MSQKARTVCTFIPERANMGEDEKVEEGECVGVAGGRGSRRDNRITTAALPDHIVTLCLIILRDVSRP